MTLPDSLNFKAHFIELFRTALQSLDVPTEPPNIELTRTKQSSHGDYSCNLAMHLAKPLRKKPQEIAQLLIERLPA